MFRRFVDGVMSHIRGYSTTGYSSANAQSSHKSIAADAGVQTYQEKYGYEESDKVRAHRDASLSLERSTMQLEPHSVRFQSWFAASVEATRIMEVGTYSGVTSHAFGVEVAKIAEKTGKTIPVFPTVETREELGFNSHTVDVFPRVSMQSLVQHKQDPVIITLDVSSQHLELAKEHWNHSGLCGSPLLFMEGNASETIQELSQHLEGTFDMIFIDANKKAYPIYYEHALRQVRQGGYIVLDNMQWKGEVVKCDNDESSVDGQTKSIHALNVEISKDPRVQHVLLPLGDGLQQCRKL